MNKFILNERFVNYQNKLISCGVADLSIAEQQDYNRMLRDAMLADTDFSRLDDVPITEETRLQYKKYRAYLRDYPSGEKWWLNPPMTFDDFVALTK